MLRFVIPLVLVLGGAPTIVSAAPELVIHGETVLADGEFTFTDPIVVGPTGRLVIRDAVVNLDMPVFCPTRGSIGYCQPAIMMDGGHLVVERSTLTTSLWDPETDNGIRIAGINGSLWMSDSVVEHSYAVGFQGAGRQGNFVRNSTFRDGWQGIRFFRGAGGEVTGSTFEDLLYAAAIVDSQGIIAGNTFRRIDGPVGAKGFGRAIDVQNSIVGEKAFGTTPLVMNNLVEDSYQGMLSLNGFPNAIQDNTFRNNVMGLTVGLSFGDLVLHEQPPTIKGNSFHGNVNGVSIYSSGQTDESHIPVRLSVVQGSFDGQQCADIEIVALHPPIDLTIDARENWWGSPDGPATDRECAAVPEGTLVAPWRTSP